MFLPLDTLARAGLVVSLAAAPALAGDYFVDASGGSDGAGGTSPADAWRTLTHALATVPAPAGLELHTIHLAPGVYDAANGESYPLEMRPRISVVGDGAPEAVVLRGGGSGALLQFTSLQSGLGESFDEDTRIVGLTLASAGNGVGLYTNWGTLAPLLADLVVRRMSGAGIAAAGGDFGAAGPFDLRLLRVRIEDCAVGVSATKYGEGGSSYVRMSDCVVAQGSGDGVELYNVSDGGRLFLEGLRTVVHDRGGDGVNVRYTNGSFVYVDLDLCELRDCADDGYEVVPDTGIGYEVRTRLRHCTVVNNADVGVSITAAGGASASHPTELDSTILWGNGDDLLDDSPPWASVVACDIGDGDHLGESRTFSADPLFLAPEVGDLRLAFGSPCIDRGAPLTDLPGGEPSLGGVAPPVDGDLDLEKRWDVGAREFAPLTLAGEAVPGGALRLAVFGRAGGAALVFASRRPLTPSPLLLPEGEWWLGSAGFPYRSVRTDPTSPQQLTLLLPNDAALVGSSLSFQAEVRAPDGAATGSVLTNPVSVVILAP